MALSVTVCQSRATHHSGGGLSLSPANVFPDYVLDTASAMGWVYRISLNMAAIPNQLFVMGHSAGAFNVVSAVDDSRFGKPGIPNKAMIGVIGLAGPYDYDFRSNGTTKLPFQLIAPPTSDACVSYPPRCTPVVGDRW